MMPSSLFSSRLPPKVVSPIASWCSFMIGYAAFRNLYVCGTCGISPAGTRSGSFGPLLSFGSIHRVAIAPGLWAWFGTMSIHVRSVVLSHECDVIVEPSTDAPFPTRMLVQPSHSQTSPSACAACGTGRLDGRCACWARPGCSHTSAAVMTMSVESRVRRGSQLGMGHPPRAGAVQRAENITRCRAPRVPAVPLDRGTPRTLSAA